MEKSAGLVILYQKKILLVHPTNSSWMGTYSIPKGKIEKNETILEAALRETKEEIGLHIPGEWIIDQTERVISYTKKDKVYKKVYYFILDLTEEQKRFLMGDSDVISSESLQVEEVDWSGFLDLNESKKRIFWRFAEVLEYIGLIPDFFL